MITKALRLVMLTLMFTAMVASHPRVVSINVWDNGNEGDYWSDYASMDENKDGVGDAPYIIDAQNVDHCPLVSSPPILDREPPNISITSPRHGEVIRSSSVAVSWEGSDYGSGISHYEIGIDGGYLMNVGLNTTYTFTELSDGRHIVKIAASDNAGNMNYSLSNFVVNTAEFERISWPPYITETVGIILIVVVLGVSLYILKGKYSFRIRKTRRRLVR